MIGTPSGADNGEPTLPASTALYQNYPNPFNPTTNISYDVGSSSGGSHVTLRVFDVMGKEVATLIDETKTAGEYDISFDARNFASGVYFYSLQVDHALDVKKMLLIR
jgi:hypothetical protein